MTLVSRLLPSVVKPPTIRFHAGQDGTWEGIATLPCPNCGSSARKTAVLTVNVQLPENPPRELNLMRCPDCTAHFFDDQRSPDYAEPALNNRGRVPFYVQQGAGVSLITRPLAQLRHGPGATYMEIGCGYGFGLDFALHTKGWTGIGIDPAPLAALGRDALRLPIELRYLRDDDEAVGTMDVVMGSEVIEHVPSPAAFVRTLRAMLKPGGTLVLTTPNGDDIRQDTPPGIIIPLLSPSLHLVIQSSESLRMLLAQAGFAHVEVDVDSHSLVAFASDTLLDLERDPATLRRVFRRHLQARATAMDPMSDVFIAFGGRAFTESVNDDDMEAADRAWALLAAACQTRYGLALDALTALPPGLATCSLEEMAHLVPLDLGAILYARAIRRLSAGTPRPGLERLFLLAAEAAAAMRRALGELAMEDGQTEDIGWTSLAEALLCAAEAGDADLIPRLVALPPAPNGGVARTRSVALRAMANLVNAGQYTPARALVRSLSLDGEAWAQPGAVLTDVERDWLFSLAMLDTEVGPNGRASGNPAAARPRLRRVRAAAAPRSGLWWAALRAEAQVNTLLGDRDATAELAEATWRDHQDADVAQWALVTLTNAGRYEAARRIATASGLGRAAFSQPGIVRSMSDQERETIYALAVLDAEIGAGGAAVGDPAMARGRFARIRHAVPAGSGLWLSALRGELQALDLIGVLTDGAKLTADVEAAHPELKLPPDILARIGKA